MARHAGSTGLARLSFDAIQAELRRRARLAGPLQRRRERLAAKLEVLGRRIEEMGGNPDGAARRATRHHPYNEMPLSQALAKLLKGKTMSVTDASEAVQKAGYRTHSSHFFIQVNTALIKGPFKRVARGQYTAA